MHVADAERGGEVRAHVERSRQRTGRAVAGPTAVSRGGTTRTSCGRPCARPAGPRRARRARGGTRRRAGRRPRVHRRAGARRQPGATYRGGNLDRKGDPSRPREQQHRLRTHHQRGCRSCHPASEGQFRGRSRVRRPERATRRALRFATSSAAAAGARRKDALGGRRGPRHAAVRPGRPISTLCCRRSSRQHRKGRG
jgi:hypothetical protein